MWELKLHLPIRRRALFYFILFFKYIEYAEPAKATALPRGLRTHASDRKIYLCQFEFSSSLPGT